MIQLNAQVSSYTFRTLTSYLSAEDFELNKIKMDPNPVGTNLKFEGDVLINQISIYNLLGQEVLSSNINDLSFTIDCSGLIQGTYFVNIKTYKGNLYKKFIKKN